jgi:hypothetical protein
MSVWEDNIEKKHCMGLWAGLISGRIGLGGGPLRTQYGFSGSVKTGNIVTR